MAKVDGTNGNDVLNGTNENDTVSGLNGNDTLNGAGGNDLLIGGAGSDLLTGGAGRDVFALTNGFTGDVITDFGGDDAISIVRGFFDEDGITATQSGSDTQLTFAGGTEVTLQNASGLANNLIAVADVFYQAPTQQYFYSGTQVLRADAGSTAVTDDRGNAAEIEIGTNSANDFSGTTGDDTLAGRAGNDTLDGGSGFDVVDGGDGNDLLRGGEGNDLLFGQDDQDQLFGGNGDDQLRGGEGNDTLRGESGNDLLRGENGGDRLEGGAGVDDLFGGSGNDTLDGGGDNDALNGDDGDDALRGGTGNDNLFGGNGKDTVEGGAGNDRIGGNEGNDVLYGDAANMSGPTDGDDTIDGGAGNDIIDGGAGSDVLIGGTGNDILYGGDQFKLNEAEGTIYRLYQATFDREPDLGGFEAQVNALNAGTSLSRIADGFVSSREFDLTYGSLSDTDFVTLLYNNVLDRAPDSNGLQYWSDRLANGQSRADTLLGFSQSSEFRSNTLPDASGFANDDLYDDIPGQVFRIYGASLDRQPDANGFEYWLDQADSGVPIETIVNGFFNSNEFQNEYGSLNDDDFVELLYQNVLGRGSDSQGFAYWTDRLATGVSSRADVLLGFSDSTENRQATAGAYDEFIENGVPNLADSFEGNEGNDILVGGVGADTFIFRADQDGSDLVISFDDNDTLRLVGFGYGSVDDARAQFQADGSDVVFDDQGVSIVFADTTLVEISQADVLIG